MTTKIEFLEQIHDAAVIANRADACDDERWQPWMKPEYCATIAQPLLNIVRDVLDDDDAYQLFLDLFGDFDSFKVAYKRHQAEIVAERMVAEIWPTEDA